MNKEKLRPKYVYKVEIHTEEPINNNEIDFEFATTLCVPNPDPVVEGEYRENYVDLWVQIVGLCDEMREYNDEKYSFHRKDGTFICSKMINQQAFCDTPREHIEGGYYINHEDNDWFFRGENLQKLRSLYPDKNLFMTLPNGKMNSGIKPSIHFGMSEEFKRVFDIPDDAYYAIDHCENEMRDRMCLSNQHCFQ